MSNALVHVSRVQIGYAARLERKLEPVLLGDGLYGLFRRERRKA